ncbi:hypothetical protein ABVK25_004065 [Lepraria finkii]|uniref:Uncharacterized protein n=1 Tax=Lepraria finkii TaxID=1340010 RepID=A0ABR4BFM9_9LECA
MKSISLLPLLLLLTGIDAALLHRTTLKDPSFPFRVRRDTQKAYIARSPQGPNSNPGEFNDPELSHANPRNSAVSSSSAAISALPSGPATTATNFEYATAAASSISAAAASSAAAEINAMMNELMNSTIIDTDAGINTIYPYPHHHHHHWNGTNTTYPYPHHHHHHWNGTNTTYPYPHHHHHHHHWNGTHHHNGTHHYNTTDCEFYIETVLANGTEIVEMVQLNSTGWPYGNGSHYHWHHGNRTHHHRPTGTGYAVLPGQTGSGPERLTEKPGFTGPKVRRRLAGLI